MARRTLAISKASAWSNNLANILLSELFVIGIVGSPLVQFVAGDFTHIVTFCPGQLQPWSNGPFFLGPTVHRSNGPTCGPMVQLGFP